MEEIHDAGVLHHQLKPLAPEDVVTASGASVIRIINFDDATFSECPVKGKWALPFDYEPLDTKYPCEELRTMMTDLHLWTPSE